MKEAQKHIDAFELYYALGPNRSLRGMQHYRDKKATKGNKVPAFRTLAKWSAEFKWQERIMLRDHELAQRVEKRVLKEEEDIRIAVYKKLKQEEQLYTAQEATAFYEKDGKTHLKTGCTPKTSTELTRVQDGKRKNLETQIKILVPEDTMSVIKLEVDIKEVVKKYKDALNEISEG